MDDNDEISCPPIRVNPEAFKYVPAIPEGFRIVIDTREQRPYKFGSIPTVTKCLKFGDYSIEGLEPNICIERKSQMDFYGSIAKGRARLYRMMDRAFSADFKAFVIDCSEPVLMAPQVTLSGLAPQSVYATINSIEVKRGYHFYYGTRRACSLKIANWLITYYKQVKSGK